MRGWLTAIFASDYWPKDDQPTVRLAMGFLAAPTPALLMTMIAAMSIYYHDEGDLNLASSMTFDVAISVATILYAAVLLGGAPALLALWAMNLRGRTAYAAAGLAVGGLAALALFSIYGAIGAIASIYLALAGALSMLTLRHLIGVRKSKPSWD